MNAAEDSVIRSVDPRTGRPAGDAIAATSLAQVEFVAEAAARAAPVLDARGRTFRVGLLHAIADGLEASRTDIVAIADRETAIGDERLNGELTRAAFQARLFAQVLSEGSYLEATIDHATATPTGPGPDLRRMLIPIGPVAVFGSSNFPLAFSVPGGDTVSALAAGNPVVLKAHSSHPATSAICFDIISRAVDAEGAPPGTVGIVFGQAAGAALVANPHIRAVGFTGSLSGARKLMEIIDGRSEPIPFYGELSSVNPVVVSDGAAAVRHAEIAAGLVASVTLSGGQLCTKPGVVFVPHGSAGDALVTETASLIARTAPRVLLNDRIRASYVQSVGADESSGLTIEARGEEAGSGTAVAARLWTVDAVDFRAAHAEERFGPSTVLVRYRDQDELLAALSHLPASLTGTLHHEAGEVTLIGDVIAQLRSRAGRILFNGFPTGVTVSWAQTHGGPWPATNSTHTSVGATAIRRFLRPVTWQNAPAAFLPEELSDEYLGIPRRIDGTLVVPS